MGPELPGFSRLSGTAQAVVTRPARAGQRLKTRATLPLVGLIRNRKSHRNVGAAADDPAIPGVLTVEPRTKAELEEALARFAERRIGVLAISGGDGTVRDVLTRGARLFGDDWPTIVVLPQGKTNALALDLGLPQRWSLGQALEAIREGRTELRRPLLVERRDGETRPRYGFIFGAGVFNAAIEAGQVAHRFGAFQSFAVAMTGLFGVFQALFGFGTGKWRKPYGMRIVDVSDGQAPPCSAEAQAATRFLAGFSTLTTFPLGIKPFSTVRDPKGIRYFFIDAPLRRAVAMLPAALLGSDRPLLRKLGIQRGSGEAFDIELDEGFILDGESFPGGDYRLSLGPDLRFVVP